MQLNSLTLNPNTPSAQSKYQLAIYDHKLAVVNTQIFVFGKNIQNFSIQTPLHKINLETLRVEPVYTVNPPLFEDFIMFSFEQNIYLWGKTSISQKNELFQFDGCKFTKMDQNGPTPQLGGTHSFTNFSHKYLLLFGCWLQDQFQNKWYIFDIKKRLWKTVISNIQIPVCQKSKLLWANGRGYLLLKSAYDKNKKIFRKNVLYEVKFKSFSRLILECTQIQLSQKIKGQNFVFTDLISFTDRQLLMIGGQQIQNPQICQQKQNQENFQSDEHKTNQQVIKSGYKTSEMKINVKYGYNPEISSQQNYCKLNLNQKVVYKLDLQTFQWSDQRTIIPIKGQNLEILSFNHKIYTIGGTFDKELFTSIQCYDFRSQQQKTKFSYQQSVCYYCECAFTYDQKLIYQPIVEKQYEKFCPKNKIENKFLRKLAQSIDTELHAIGIICEYLRERRCQNVQINLMQFIKPKTNIQIVKPQIETFSTQILALKGKNLQSPQQDILSQIFSSSQKLNDPPTIQELHLNFTKIKIASFKIGYGLLFVSSTEQGSTFVGYCSYSQTQFPESNYRSFSQIFYTVKYDRLKYSMNYSSQNKRKIIFQNVKLHFGSSGQYENLNQTVKNTSKSKINHFTHLYVIGSTNLQKTLSVENNYAEDIQVNSLNKKNPSNSLRKYLKHLYLTENQSFDLFLQNQQVQLISIYEKFDELRKSNIVIEIPTNEESLSKKVQNEQTHFSTNHDQIIVSWKKIQIVEKCKLYEINENQQKSPDSIYKNIFVYHNKKLLKTISTKKSVICGVIELLGNLELGLNGKDLVSKSDERNLLRWVEQIGRTIIDEIESQKEQS